MATRPQQIRWAYGVTTVPARGRDLLPRTLASLAASGFDSPHLFVDGEPQGDGKTYYERYKLPVTVRGGPAVRAYGNWILALGELFIRYPNHTRFAMFQDDLVVCQNLKEYLTQLPMPEAGYCNLFTFPANEISNRQRREATKCTLPDNHRGWYPANQRGRGAVALIFSREAVVAFFTNQTTKTQPEDANRHMVSRPLDPNRGYKAIDGGVVTALAKVGIREYVHNPCLVQHTGIMSSIGNRRHPDAPNFVGENFDALSLLSGG